MSNIDYTKIKTGTKVLGKYYDSDWEETEFLKYDKDMEYGKFVCLTWAHDGKMVDVFDEIKLIEEDEEIKIKVEFVLEDFERCPLKVGDKYEVVLEKEKEYYVKNEYGELDSYPKHWFKLIK